ncbi:hypothetical protein BJF78_18495 [Pseudonocardia sp. CNS-139]|nr:hypothetical protein BJF78_18495 [Pseudonocardia sp. CNS-139]
MDENDTRGPVETAQAPAEDWREVSGGGATSDRPLAVPFRGTDWNIVRGARGNGLFRNSDRQWREFLEAGRVATNMPPAGVTYQDRLFLFHVGLQPPGPSETTRVFRTNFDGSSWHPWLPVPGTAAESSQPVGAAVDRATNRLVIVFTQRITLNPHVLSTGGSNPGARGPGRASRR